jgi:hypothetical protein
MMRPTNTTLAGKLKSFDIQDNSEKSQSKRKWFIIPLNFYSGLSYAFIFKLFYLVKLKIILHLFTLDKLDKIYS